jgi:hypothetical protein
MMTAEKPKHKNIPGAVRRFQAGLFVWTLFVLVMTGEQEFWLWLLPPYTHFTPFLYFGLSLLWLPFTLVHVWRSGLHVMTILLIVASIFITSLSVRNFDYRRDNPARGNCYALPDKPAAYTCTTGCFEGDDDRVYFTFERVGNLPFMRMTNWLDGLTGCP